MDRARLLELLDAYLEQRLTAESRAVLNAELRASADARRVFWEYVHQHALLGELLAEARGLQLAAEELALPSSPSAPPRLHWIHWASLATALSLLLFVLAWLFRSPATPPDANSAVLARLGEVHGEVTISADSGPIPAHKGQVLRPGQEIHTGEDSFAIVTYDDDDSRLELTPESAIRLVENEAGKLIHSVKHVFLVKGVVSATVAPRSRSMPMVFSTAQADLLAPHGRFSSTSVMGETRIEMEEGKGVLTARGETRGVEIQTGTYAVAAHASDLEVFSPAAMLPASTVPAAVLEDPSGPVLGLAALGQGRKLAIACSNGAIKLWDVHTRKAAGVLNASRKRALALAVAGDGRHLAVGYEPQQRESAVLVWDAERRRVVEEVPVLRRTHTLGFTPDSLSLVLPFGDRNTRGVVVWDRGDSRPRLILGDRLERPQVLAVSPDGRIAASGYRDGTVRLWDLQTGRPVTVLAGHTREVQALAFQPGGGLLASGSRDGTVRLWSMGTYEGVRQMTGKFGEVRCLAFSPGGQTLASGHAGVALMWDPATGQQRGMLKAHKFAISALVYLPDGQTLATAGWDRAVKLWDLKPVQAN